MSKLHFICIIVVMLYGCSIFFSFLFWSSTFYCHFGRRMPPAWTESLNICSSIYTNIYIFDRNDEIELKKEVTMRKKMGNEIKRQKQILVRYKCVCVYVFIRRNFWVGFRLHLGAVVLLWCCLGANAYEAQAVGCF